MASPFTTADLRVLFATRLLRMFAYGMLSVILVLYLVRLGFDIDVEDALDLLH